MTLRLYDAITVSRILISNDGVPDDNWDSRDTHIRLSQPLTDKVTAWDTDITPGLSKLYYLPVRGPN